ncbi:MAG: long-chain-fatty-acid--CoA ligase [Dehalococcoidia bacterium]|nr:long-chain-fatty-acid--CoA ligase [Dehalococcoidia bacterium]
MLLHDVLSHSTKLYPNKIATIDGDTQYTYAQEGDRIHRLAAGLLGLGLKPGDNIAILANNSHRYFEVYFVCSLAGMPLAPLNIRLAASELEFILNDGEIKALFLGPEYAALYEQFKDKAPGLKHVIALNAEIPGAVQYEDLIANNEPLAKPAREWLETDMLNLCYTGGTTGLPKGVMLSQRAVVSNAQHAVMTCSFQERDIWLHVAPMFHLADAWAVYSFCMVGGTHVFNAAFNPQLCLETIEKHKVTKTILVPTMVNFLVNFPGLANYDTSSLDLVLYGASPMPVDRLVAAKNALGPKLIQAYGMTETSPLLTAMHLEWTYYEGPEEKVRRLASCGRQVSGVDVRVVDQTTGEDVKPGQVGEIIAAGPNIMNGYWKRPKETAEALRGGYMHTGDLATVDEENFIFIVDRAKDMIVSGGENVYCAEVENALYDHPDVLEAAVIGIPDDRWGEAVLAIVVPKEGKSPSEGELIEHCRGLIAGYKCPKSVVFQAQPLPKSGPGKILKTELRKPYWEGKSRNVN